MTPYVTLLVHVTPFWSHVTLRVTLPVTPPAARCWRNRTFPTKPWTVARLAGVMWRRRAMLGVLGIWSLVSLARLTRLVEPPAVPPAQELVPALGFFRASIPPDAGYLFVEPGEFGSDTGVGQRLRYELYPRAYDDVRPSQPEPAVRQLMQAEGLSYIVVPDASQYPPTSWLREPRDWLRRIELDSNRYVLAVVA